MKRHVWMGATMALAAVSMVGAAAQTGTPTTSPQSGSTRGSGTVTVTGCLQGRGAGAPGSSAGSTTAGTAGSTSSSMTNSGYTLTHAMMGSSGGAAGSSTSGTTAGTTGSTGSGSTGSPMSGYGTGSTYILTGNDSELKNHLGHKVEVTGTVDSTTDGTGSTSSSGTSTSATSSGTTGSTSSNASGSPRAAEHLRVLSVKMISADCSATK